MYLLYPIINKTLVDVAKLGLAINIKQYVCPSTKLTMKIFFIQLLFFSKTTLTHVLLKHMYVSSLFAKDFKTLVYGFEMNQNYPFFEFTRQTK